MLQLSKRRISILSSVALLPMLLAGCGSASPSATSSKVVNLTMWNDETGARLTSLNTMVNLFNKTHKNIHITNQFITQSDQMLPKLASAITSHSQPNIIEGASPTWGPVLLKSGAVLTLNKKLIPNQSEIYPGIQASNYYKGKEFAVGDGAGDVSLFYNKTDFAKAGITSPPTTWAQVIKDAVKLTNPAQHHYGIYMPYGQLTWTPYTWEIMLWSEGGHFMNANKTKVAFDSPAGVKALTLWVNMIYKYHAAPTTSFATPSNGDGSSAFASNVVAMLMDGSWDLKTFSAAHINYGVVLFPKVKQYATNTGVNDIILLKGSSAQNKAAAEFTNWFLAPKNLAKLYQLNGEMMPVTSAVDNLPAYKSFIANAPGLKPFIQNLKYAHSQPTLVSYPAIAQVLGNEINLALLKQITPAQALKVAAQKSDQILAQNNE